MISTKHGNHKKIDNRLAEARLFNTHLTTHHIEKLNPALSERARLEIERELEHEAQHGACKVIMKDGKYV